MRASCVAHPGSRISTREELSQGGCHQLWRLGRHDVAGHAIQDGASHVTYVRGYDGQAVRRRLHDLKGHGFVPGRQAEDVSGGVRLYHLIGWPAAQQLGVPCGGLPDGRFCIRALVRSTPHQQQVMVDSPFPQNRGRRHQV